MKKVLGFVLLMVVCLSLVACGGKSKKNEIVGEWIMDETTSIVFHEDGTAVQDGTESKWSYDEDADMYTLYLELPVTFSIEEEDGVRFFNVWDMVTYYHADDYEKVEK